MLMAALGEKKPVLERSVVALFIAGEEGAESGVGVDMVVNAGKIDELKNGPVVWIDSADSLPCIGTAGVLQWHLKATGQCGIRNHPLALSPSRPLTRRKTLLEDDDDGRVPHPPSPLAPRVK